MRVGLYTLWNANWDGHTLRLMGCNARYLRNFLELTEGVRLFTSVAAEPQVTNTEPITDPRLEVVPIPWDTFVSGWCNVLKLYKLFALNLDGLDAVYARVFDPCTWLLASLCEAKQLGLVYDVVGNPARELLQRRNKSWAGSCARRLMFFVEESLVFRAARRHVLLLNGGDVTRAYSHLHPAPENIISSTLDENDFYSRADTCTGDEPIILFTGFLRSAKGLMDLFAAVGLLVRQGRRIRLRLVGPAESPTYLELLKTQIRSEGLERLVDLPGYVPLGAPINAEYRSADVYAFPSLSEGAARTLLEAASQSLPLVITDVGGARDLFVDGQSALIVPCGDPKSLAQGIARFLDDAELRRRCIRNARQIASCHTCRSFIEHLVRRMDEAHQRAVSGRGQVSHQGDLLKA